MPPQVVASKMLCPDLAATVVVPSATAVDFGMADFGPEKWGNMWIDLGNMDIWGLI